MALGADQSEGLSVLDSNNEGIPYRCKLPINWIKKQPNFFCQLKYLIQHTVALVQQIDNVE